jgi:hypothetical protein
LRIGDGVSYERAISAHKNVASGNLIAWAGRKFQHD